VFPSSLQSLIRLRELRWINLYDIVLITDSSHSQFIGATMWSAGGFDPTTYELSLVPTNGVDTLLASSALIPKLGPSYS
jgi:hypothetical protein